MLSSSHQKSSKILVAIHFRAINECFHFHYPNSKQSTKKTSGMLLSQSAPHEFFFLSMNSLSHTHRRSCTQYMHVICKYTSDIKGVYTCSMMLRRVRLSKVETKVYAPPTTKAVAPASCSKAPSITATFGRRSLLCLIGAERVAGKRGGSEEGVTTRWRRKCAEDKVALAAHRLIIAVSLTHTRPTGF